MSSSSVDRRMKVQRSSEQAWARLQSGLHATALRLELSVRTTELHHLMDET